jgi:putative transcriptional regulator
MESLRGHLLISGASLIDPNFRRTVVLIGHHDEEGAVGVVLNRETEVPVADAVPALASLVPPGERLFLGGPVQPQAAVVLQTSSIPSA